MKTWIPVLIAVVATVVLLVIVLGELRPPQADAPTPTPTPEITAEISTEIAAIATPIPNADGSATAVARSAEPITLVSWNVESGGALQTVVADRIAAFDGVDI